MQDRREIIVYYGAVWCINEMANLRLSVLLLTSLAVVGSPALQIKSHKLIAVMDSGYTDDVVAMATAQQEKYKCVLPKLHTNEEDEVCVYINYMTHGLPCT